MLVLGTWAVQVLLLGTRSDGAKPEESQDLTCLTHSPQASGLRFHASCPSPGLPYRIVATAICWAATKPNLHQTCSLITHNPPYPGRPQRGMG
jgi:hypothetical protein